MVVEELLQMEARCPAVVAVPVYRNPVAYEEISLKQCLKVLGKYRIVLVTSESMDVSGFLAIHPFAVERFADDFFTGTESYSRLLLSKEFYLRFEPYEYLLICQLDAFVFSDRLLEFCQKDYDYIGAPVPRWAWPFHENRVGNGGFSLRRVSSCLRVLTEKPPQEMFADRSEWLPEDHYFAMCAEQEELGFRVPSLRDALEFSVDYELFHCCRKLSRWLPFACHAWQKKLDVWKPVIESFGYDASTLDGGERDDFFQDVMRRYAAQRLARQKKTVPQGLAAVRMVIRSYGTFALWGFGREGQRWASIFRHAGVPIPIIFDRHAEGTEIPVLYPSREAVTSCGRVILITSTRYLEDIACELRSYGLQEGRDFMDAGCLLDAIGKEYFKTLFRKTDGLCAR